ncbi:TolC family protein [Pseudomonas sp. NBRC 111123]|uniref:TolC family protein n=1 Tax=Pseudomonas sp. NBRC 111123 TaxID=1661038 RepID=UPI000761F679|nr:TolC family protein [Pseudomonas sp. NBRC 111123]
MTKRLMAVWALFLPLLALADSGLRPSRPTLPHAPPVSALSVAHDGVVAIELVDAIALALRDNRAIRSAYLQRIAQKFDLRVARDHYAPQLSLKARYSGNRNHSDRYREAQLTPAASLLTPFGTRLSLDWAYGHTRADGAGRRFSDGANFLIIQPLLRGAGREIASAPLRQARLAEQLNRLALKDDVIQIITRTITLYRSLLRAQEQLRIADDGLLRSRQLVAVNRELIAAGRMAAFDIVQAEAEVASQELAREGSRNHLQQSRLALAQLLAIDLSTELKAVEALHVEPLQVDIDQALARAELLQPAYLMQRVASEQALIDLQVAHDAQWWNLSLVGGASQLRERPGNERTWEHYVGLELEVPINDVSRRQALVRAQVSVDQQALSQAESRQQLQREVTSAVRDIQVRWRQLKLAERALALSRRTFDIEQEKLAAGRSSNFQVLSFESDLRYAQSTHLDATLDYLDAQVVLDQVVGSTLESWEVALND